MGAIFLKVRYLKQTVISLVAINLLLIVVGDLIHSVQIFLGLKVTIFTGLSSSIFSPHTKKNKANDMARVCARVVMLTLMTLKFRQIGWDFKITLLLECKVKPNCITSFAKFPHIDFQ